MALNGPFLNHRSAGLILSIVSLTSALPCTVAAAASDTDPRLTPTRHCLGIVTRVTSAGGGPCVPHYRRRGEERWAEGQVLFEDVAAEEARGSLVGLEPGTEYELLLRPASAPADRPPAPITFHTLGDPPAEAERATGKVYHVAADAGDDGNPGTADRPFRTLAEAAAVARAGDTVLVGAGQYGETLTLERGGEPGRYVTFRSAEPGRAVLDGEGTRDHNVVVRGAGYVRLGGFEMRGAQRSAVVLTRDADHVVVEDNTILDPGTEYFDAAVEVRSGCGGAVVRNNRISFTAGEYRDGRMGVSLRHTDGGHLIYANTIQGNGLIKDGVGGEPNFELAGGLHRDTDVYDNVISGCRDDGIEAEGGNVNVRIWGNRVDDCVIGIALAPTIRGPCYVWRNVVTNVQSAAFKLGEGGRAGHGALYLYHNTVHSPDTKATAYAGYGGDGLFEHVTARNNLVHVGGYVLEAKGAGANNSFDYDLIWLTDPDRFAKWGGRRLSLRDAQDDPGLWQHAVLAEPDFVQSGDHPFALLAGSAAVDAGEVLSGFNVDFGGAGPDVGAFELESPPSAE